MELLQLLGLSLLPDGRSISYTGGCLYIFDVTVFITLNVCVMYFMSSPRWLVVGPRSLERGLFTNFQMCDYTAFAVSRKVGIP